MTFETKFAPYWYILFTAFLLAWIGLLVIRRKDVTRKELTQNFLFSTLGLFVAAAMEVFAVSTNLWNYTPANWPVMLWFTYFSAALFGFQLMMLVSKNFWTTSSYQKKVDDS